MRAITVRQPWAWAIVHGGKDVENRTRNIAGGYRGPVAIHVSQSIDYAVMGNPGPQLSAAADAYRDANPDPRYGAPWFHHTGHIIGIVDLVHVHPDCTELVEGFGHTPTCSAWAMSDHWHLHFDNPRPLATPILYKGRLGLWTLPDDVLAGAR